MLIIVSGCDKVGKTTVLNRINKHTGIQVGKFRGPKKRIDTKDEVREWADECLVFHRSILRYLELLNTDRNIILLDRFYPDEVVYSQTLRNLHLWSEYKDLDERFAKIGTKYIYIAPPNDFEMYRKRFEIEEDMTKWDEVQSLLDCFRVFYEWTGMDKITITQDTPIRDIVNFICSRKVKSNEKVNRVK